MSRLNYAGGISRRGFLKAGAAVPALAAAPSIFLGATERDQLHRNGHSVARNVIFLVSDGMSAGTLSMADHIRRRHHGHASHWMSLYENDLGHLVRRGVMDMASRDAIVTDSAAAASSWGCGHRVNNNSVNMGPTGEVYPTVLELFRDGGKATGLVTTTTITHATPAGFGANVPSRAMENDIAVQYLERGYDVLLGGGSVFFDPGTRPDGRDLFADFTRAGYQVLRTRDQLTSVSPNGRLLGTFYDRHLPYTLDHLAMPELRRDVPTLAEMSAAALGRLDRSPNGFILQIEGGRVDHGAHSNDAAGMLFDQIAFDDAIGTVLDFVENRDDTLVILTTDHGNANPALNGFGRGYQESDAMFDRLMTFPHTNNRALSQLNRESTAGQIREVIEANLGLEITPEEAQDIHDAFRGQSRATFRLMRSPSAVLGKVVGNYTAVNFTSGNHTSDLVELAAFGPGSEQLTGFTRNTDLFDLMLTATGVAEAVTR
jgi:alkaline phosphatase